MGFLDLFGGSSEKRIKSLQKKITEKYGPPENRQKAIEQLLDVGTPAALAALMMRFTVAAEPSITDAEEKDYTFNAILKLDAGAVEPIQGFLRRSVVATSWAVKLLRQILPEADFVALCIDILAKQGPEYTRDPEKKTVLINTLGELKDDRIVPALAPFLTDPSDDVRIAAASALTRLRDERSREALLTAFVDSLDRGRVVAALAASLAELGFGVQGFREKVERALPAGYFVDRAGLVKKSG